MEKINGTDSWTATRESKGLVNARQITAVIVIVTAEAIRDPEAPPLITTRVN